MGTKNSSVLGESSVLSASQWNIWFNRDGSPLYFRVGWGLLPRFYIDPSCSVFPLCKPSGFFFSPINCLILLQAFCVPLDSLLLSIILVGWGKHMVLFTLVAVFKIPSEHRQIHCTFKALVTSKVSHYTQIWYPIFLERKYVHFFTAYVLIQFKAFFTLCRNYLNQKFCCSLQRGVKINLFILLKYFALYMKTDTTD